MFTKLVILSIWITLINSEDCQCGIENSESRIIGGELVTQYKHPWMAFILAITPDGTYSCGGSIIHEKFILTAAHCLYGAESANISVGSIFDASNNSLIEAEMAYIHGRYNRKTHRHDIAVIKLKEPLQLSREIRPICLPKQDMSTKGPLTVAGWGITETGDTSNRLLETTVYEYPFEECNTYWNRTLAHSQFCAFSENKDTCAGDGGGPLIRHWQGKNYVVGVVSIGDEYCKSQKKSIFTRVSSYIGWIQRRAKGVTFCQ